MRRYSRSPQSQNCPHSRVRVLGRLRGSMKGLAVMHRLTLKVASHDQADEAAERQDEHHRSQSQRDR
jgi:hypothetical protein